MKKVIIGTSFALLSLSSGCTSTGALSPQGQMAVTAFCTANAAAPSVIAVGGQIAVKIDPSVASDVALAGEIDALVHPAVVAACASVGGVPASVTIAPAS